MFWAARATLDGGSGLLYRKGMGNLVKLHRAGDRPLQLLVFNEGMDSASHQLAGLRPTFVHTRPSYYRLNGREASGAAS